MINRLHQLKSGIRYYTFSRHRRGNGIHSPFVYGFIRNVLMKSKSNNNFIAAKNNFDKLAPNFNLKYLNEEKGAGSQVKSTQHNLKRLAKTSGLAPKYLKLIGEIVSYFKVERFLELGTCCGITSAAVANEIGQGQVTTIEANEYRAAAANLFFKQLELENIDLKVDDFDSALKELISDQFKFDLAFIDGDHTYEATIKNYNSVVSLMSENGIIILDDIYWTKEMTRAWDDIKLKESATVTIDLFRFGIVFLNRSQAKEHFVIRY